MGTVLTIHFVCHEKYPQKIKKKVFGVGSEMLIKYKRIKWTPSRKASHLLPGGKTSFIRKESIQILRKLRGSNF